VGTTGRRGGDNHFQQLNLCLLSCNDCVVLFVDVGYRSYLTSCDVVHSFTIPIDFVFFQQLLFLSFFNDDKSRSHSLHPWLHYRLPGSSRQILLRSSTFRRSSGHVPCRTPPLPAALAFFKVDRRKWRYAISTVCRLVDSQGHVSPPPK